MRMSQGRTGSLRKGYDTVERLVEPDLQFQEIRARRRFASRGTLDLKDRTLTNLYNQAPTWLQHAHQALDRAVYAAYGWEHDLDDEQILERLLALNLIRSNLGAYNDGSVLKKSEV